ncbi:L,D-transpeptidase [Metabacillus sp. GX 13764]|uniref:L,D-transpeptidase n=1 Tax=Metabacillus kandeliae TaxID=2900151 RepID=UPI001E55B902|nr:L,D-transpeptidase [Metabacillus kandeliae]MCD7033241.1 L,D-transpeptidase [Metabacillus kandeliae]
MKLFFAALIVLSHPAWPIGTHPYPGDPYIIINKEKNQLALIENGSIQKLYSIATGKLPELTPEGEFTIVVKAEKPYYRKKSIPGGDPKNPLGARWIGFDAGETDGRIYGIHGTNNENSIGKYETLGCIRMHNNEVIEFYQKVAIGTKIFVTKSKKSFDTLAKEKGALPFQEDQSH